MILILVGGALVAAVYAILVQGLQRQIDDSLREQARLYGADVSAWFYRETRRFPGPAPRGVGGPGGPVAVGSPGAVGQAGSDAVAGQPGGPGQPGVADQPAVTVQPGRSVPPPGAGRPEPGGQIGAGAGGPPG